MVVGENQKFAGALIIPNIEYIRIWCKKESKNCPKDEDLIKSEVVRKKIQSEIFLILFKIFSLIRPSRTFK